MRRKTAHTLAIAGAVSGSLASSGLPVRVSAQDDYWVDTDDAASQPTRRATRTGTTLGQISARDVPATYSVRRGDTLWGITGYFYGNPYDWPRVWSYNPEITNPHWIYPDQQVRLIAEGAPAAFAAPQRSGRIVVRQAVASGTVFLREQGWLDDDALETAGEIVGSPDDHMMLAPFDQAYVRFDNLPEGQREPSGEYSVFRQIEASQRSSDETGTIVRILGTVRVDSWDEERKTARVTVVEALDPIERGFHVAAIPRRFEVVAPRRTDVELDTNIVATLEARQLVGDQQVVFVPVGADDGVLLGNRMMIVRAGDEWRQDLASSQREAASVDPPAEPDEYPDEVIAEGRVVAVRENSAALLVVRATRPVSVGDRAQLRPGY